MYQSNKAKMKKCLKKYGGDVMATTMALSQIMKDNYGNKPPQRITHTIVTNVAAGRTKGVEYHIGVAMDKLIKNDELGVVNAG